MLGDWSWKPQGEGTQQGRGATFPGSDELFPPPPHLATSLPGGPSTATANPQILAAGGPPPAWAPISKHWEGRCHLPVAGAEPERESGRVAGSSAGRYLPT